MARRTVLAVDLGAESGRVMAAHFDGRTLALEALQRFPNTTVTVNGTLYWDFLRLWSDVEQGIRQGLRLAPAGIGIDTWGVDFGLLDTQGTLIANPVNYRDSRTDGMMDRAYAKVSREEIFQQTGIQFMPINTIYQLLSLVESNSPLLEIAETFLTAPDLLNYWLTGVKVCEFSNATTTQLFNPTTGSWATELMADLGIPARIFPEVVQPGTRLGSFEGVPVIAPACHDTGSAVAAVPATETDFAYISSGTWSLVGLEMDRPVVTDTALQANVTNEGGVYGTYRLLKNVMGLWILQQCRATWAAAGESYSYEALVAAAEQAPPLQSIFVPNDPAFLAPGDHPAFIREMCRRSGQAVPDGVGALTRAVLESLALAYREVLERVCQVAERQVSIIHIVGGGSQNDLLNQMTADATGLPVVSGPVEATVLGNALVQLIALGEIQDLAEARQLVASMAGMRRWEPAPSSNSGQAGSDDWDAAYETYKQLRNT